MLKKPLWYVRSLLWPETFNEKDDGFEPEPIRSVPSDLSGIGSPLGRTPPGKAQKVRPRRIMVRSAAGIGWIRLFVKMAIGFIFDNLGVTTSSLRSLPNGSSPKQS